MGIKIRAQSAGPQASEAAAATLAAGILPEHVGEAISLAADGFSRSRHRQLLRFHRQRQTGQGTGHRAPGYEEAKRLLKV